MGRYKEALKYFTVTTTLSAEEKAKIEAANAACNLNIAACQLKLHAYREVGGGGGGGGG